MPDRLDGFLSGKAQAVWPSALVYQTEAGRYELRRTVKDPERRIEVLDLGDTFKAARMALYALIRAHHRAAAIEGSKE